MARLMLTMVFLLGSLLVAAGHQEESVSGSGERGSGLLGEINILLLLSFEIEDPTSQQPWYTDGPSIAPAAELAVEQINEREDILAGYSVNLIVANSACNVSPHTVVNFVTSFFHSGVRFAGIVGPSCSESVSLISHITAEEDVAILNFHIANSPHFADRSRYGYSFGPVGSAYAFVKQFVLLMKENEWESVAVLYEESKFVYLTSYDLLLKELPQVYPQGRVAFSAPVSDFGLPLSSIIDQHIRVIFVLSGSSLAQKIMCLIKRRHSQLAFPAYQFLFTGASFNNPANFTLNDRRYVCSAEEIVQGVEGFLLTDLKLAEHNASMELVSGVTYGEFSEQYRARLNASFTEWANPVYDGVWSLALALNNSIPRLSDIGLDLVDYMYGHREATDIIRDEVFRLGFDGASGRIAYSNETGYAPAAAYLYQVVNHKYSLVGYYSEDTQQFLLVQDTNFVDNSFESVELVVHPALASLFVFVIVVALVLVVGAHVMTLANSKFVTIRTSSYRLGQLIFIGCYVIAVSFLCFTTYKVATTTSVNITSLCIMQAWTLPLGLTLILGTLTAKTWRLYRIFFLLKKPGKFLQDRVVIAVVLALAGIDVILCSVWTIGFKFYTIRRERFTDDNIIQAKVNCFSENYYTWFLVFMIYLASIMVSALVLAILTRKIRHENFKTGSVTVLVYLLSISLLIGFPLYGVLNITDFSGVNLEYMVLSLTYVSMIYFCFFFLFFPPLLPLLRVKYFHKLPGLKRFSENVTTKSYRPSSFTP